MGHFYLFIYVYIFFCFAETSGNQMQWGVDKMGSCPRTLAVCARLCAGGGFGMTETEPLRSAPGC